jgi:hypothetical protein
MQGACDVVPGPDCDDGQHRRSAGAEVDSEVDRAVPAGDCQDVKPGGDTGQGAVAGTGRALIGEVDHLMALGL